MVTEEHDGAKVLSLNQEKSTWTWADQISTYRFWGIIAFYFFSLIGSGILQYFLIGTKQYTVFISTMSISAIFALYPAWIASRYNAKAMLLAAGFMQLAGIIVVSVPALPDAWTALLPAAILLGLGSGMIGLLVPVILANGRGGLPTLAVSIGSMTIFASIGGLCTSLAGAFIVDDKLPGDLIAISAAVAGILFLLPVKAALFKESPPKRGYSLSPRYRNPVYAGLACCIPFYGTYWVYRLHGEVSAVAPSRKLLSPRACLLVLFLVPFLFPMVMASLADALNSREVEYGNVHERKVLPIILWSFFFLPAALAMIQSMLNKAMRIASSATTAAGEAI